jgi:hypothetical protein
MHTLAERCQLGAVGVPGQGSDLVTVIRQHHTLSCGFNVPKADSLIGPDSREHALGQRMEVNQPV